jgi:phospholipid transport system substrate-binding protein
MLKNSKIFSNRQRVSRRFNKGKLRVVLLLVASFSGPTTFSGALASSSAEAPQLICSAARAQQDPMALIQSGTEKALRILHDSQTGQTPSLRQRKGEILAVVSEYFSFEEMAKRSLGRRWKEQPSDKCEEFTRLFKQLLFNTYISRIENYTGSNEQVFYDYQKLDGDYALVKAHILSQGNDNISIEYRLHRDGEQWRVYDVAVEGISFVDNYRSQFSSILTNESFDSLLVRLHQKVDESH